MMLSQSHAERIKSKLEVDVKEGRKHHRVHVFYDGYPIGAYSILRGSEESNHNFVARQLHISLRQAADLARCSLEKEDYYNILRDKGVLPTLPKQGAESGED